MMTITFPGGVRVNAAIDTFDIVTDQPAENGGDNSAPSPFSLFLASLGTCAGFFALRFCQQRDLPTEGMQLTMESERNPDSKRLERIKMILTLPSGFPDRYHRPMLRAIDQCAVKKALLDPPEISVDLAQSDGI
ncbi:MAG: OsmC family protein [Desulfuromonadales bacterium]|jgi:putative redox protein